VSVNESVPRTSNRPWIQSFQAVSLIRGLSFAARSSALMIGQKCHRLMTLDLLSNEKACRTTTSDLGLAPVLRLLSQSID